jgi:hypothetical protein
MHNEKLSQVQFGSWSFGLQADGRDESELSIRAALNARLKKLEQSFTL